jgi:hypothetical protein
LLLFSSTLTLFLNISGTWWVKFMLSTYFTPRETAHVHNSWKVWKPVCTQRWTKLFLLLLWIKSAVQVEASHSMHWKFKMKS